MTGVILSPIPKLENTFIEKASTKPEKVELMIRIDDTVVVKKANGRITILRQDAYDSFDKGAYSLQVWPKLFNVLKCIWKLKIISKSELKKHIKYANMKQLERAEYNMKTEIKNFSAKYNVDYEELIQKIQLQNIIDTKLYDTKI